MQQFFEVAMKVRGMPVYLSKECHVPVPMSEPVPNLGRPVGDVCGEDDHMVVRGLARLNVDWRYLRRARCSGLPLMAPKASSL